ncbi:MAG: methyltransferase domain-containing protein [Pseudomonadota bacterium]
MNVHLSKKIKFILFPTVRNLMVRRLMSALDFKGIESVLVIGAGNDPYRSSFREATHYICLDSRKTQGVTDVIADGMSLPFVDSYFHCIVATEVLEFIREPHTFAREIHRVLMQGGIAILTIPFMFNIHNDRVRLTQLSLIEIFDEFTEVTVITQGNRLHTIWDLVTTSFWPWSIFLPLRILSNLFFLVPSSLMLKDSKSSAPTGYSIILKK